MNLYQSSESFERLKSAMAQEPVLRLYRVGAETELHTDASKLGLGAIILPASFLEITVVVPLLSARCHNL